MEKKIKHLTQRGLGGNSSIMNNSIHELNAIVAQYGADSNIGQLALAGIQDISEDHIDYGYHRRALQLAHRVVRAEYLGTTPSWSHEESRIMAECIVDHYRRKG